MPGRTATSRTLEARAAAATDKPLEFKWHQDRVDPNDWHAKPDGAGLHVWRCMGGGWQWRMGPTGEGAQIGNGALQSRSAAQRAAEGAYREWRAGRRQGDE